jgi:nucleotide-binding universal stress UspA family protein
MTPRLRLRPQVGADLVVLGAKGDAAMGSVSAALLKALPCPVMLVKASARLADVDWSRAWA